MATRRERENNESRRVKDSSRAQEVRRRTRRCDSCRGSRLLGVANVASPPPPVENPPTTVQVLYSTVAMKLEKGTQRTILSPNNTRIKKRKGHRIPTILDSNFFASPGHYSIEKYGTYDTYQYGTTLYLNKDCTTGACACCDIIFKNLYWA